VAIGGSATPFDLPHEWAQLAIRAAAAVGADYAGVDLLPSRDGQVFVLEVNGIPGWEGFQKATGIDVAGAIVGRLMARVAAKRAAVVEAVEEVE
jgi:ribosomal protein S6--L-glutamate ligase